MAERPASLLEDRHLAPLYHKMPVTVVKGEGPYVWDDKGKRYLDFVAGYGVALLGHCHPAIVEAVRSQASKLITCHGSLYNDTRAGMLECLVKIAPPGLDAAFLCNSGSEAVEAALKLARKYTGRKKVVAMMGSYHGKTMGALSVTWNPRYRRAFDALISGVDFAPFGDGEQAASRVDSETAAVIVEPIQGESGVRIPPPGFLKTLEEACKAHGALLIIDEVQSGLGRTGRMWAHEHWDIRPDIMCIGKGVAGGVPMGMTLAPRLVMEAFERGEHTTTFGGNPLACAAAAATLDYIYQHALSEKAAETGSMLKSALERVASENRAVREVRGMGLMLAVESRFPIGPTVSKAVETGLLSIQTGRNILRLLPPLIIAGEHVGAASAALGAALQVAAATPPG